MSLFGKVISIIVFVGIIAFGLVLVGISISKFIDKVYDRKEKRRLAREQAADPYAEFADNRSSSTKRHGELDVFADSKNLKKRRRHGDATPEFFETQTKQINRGYQNDYSKSAYRGTPGFEPGVFDGSFAPQNEQLVAPVVAQADFMKAYEGEDSAPAKEDFSTKDYSEFDAKPATDKKPKAPAKPKEKAPVVSQSTAPGMVVEDDEVGYTLPPMTMLSRSYSKSKDSSYNSETQATAALLQRTLQEFNLMAEVVGWVEGPTVTLFKLDMPSGVSVKRVGGLADDIQLALATTGIRIFAPIPGTNFVGVEVPNKTRKSVLLGDLLQNIDGSPLMIAIGKDVQGNGVVVDLAKMPHLLIGGTTNSGKSVSIHSMLCSILMRCTPDEVRFILIDPKRVEFIPYNGIPHLYTPVVTEAKEASNALSWCVAEMERRLRLFSANGARNIIQFNSMVDAGKVEAKDAIKLPYIVVAIDELADLMMSSGKEVEFSICRLAQLARAAGIHLIVATQRPDAKTVTGLIRSNITNRIALKVGTGNDSRIILDTPGAENLVGRGDLLFKTTESKPQRLQAPMLTDSELNNILSFWRKQNVESDYHPEILKTNLIAVGDSMTPSSGGGDDPLLWDAAEFVVASKMASTSGIQRHFSVGYARAGRIMDMLEDKGIVGPQSGSKPRELLVDAQGLEELKNFEMSADR
ncbi:MAG: DNA translocase FtsK [Eggerthellaceae bacterium]|nr:DNA translocase FtsK [Eggerthellaceae bacterium]